LGGSLSSFAVPALLGLVVDAMNNKDWHLISMYCLYMLLIVVFSGIMVLIRGTTFNMMSERIAKFLRYDLFYFLINKDITFFDE
jgi:ABC-type bacteriocin/lantibiotic exporter with double-glycine peptidase domain